MFLQRFAAPMTSVLRVASTTSSAMTDRALIFRMRSVCTNSTFDKAENSPSLIAEDHTIKSGRSIFINFDLCAVVFAR